MLPRLTWIALPLLLVPLAAVWSAQKADPKPAPKDVFEGKVVTCSSQMLIIIGEKDPDTYKFAVSDATKVTRNGQEAKLTEVRPGDMVKVAATGAGEKLTATRIDAKSPQ